MAVSKLTCPECKSVLRPAKPVPAGKTVKCPECGNRFTVGDEEPDAPPRKPKKAPASEEEAAERKPKRAADGNPAPKKAAAKKPAVPDNLPIPLQKDDDDEDGGGTYRVEDVGGGGVEEEDKPDVEYAPDMSIKDLRGPANSALVQPSNMMILVGGLGFFGWVLLLLLILIPTMTPVESDDGGDKSRPPKQVVGIEHGLATVQDEKDVPAEMKDDPSRKSMFEIFGVNIAGFGTMAWYLFILVILPIFVGMVYCALATYGAVKIQNLESYGWGIASCILLMLPLVSFGFMTSTGLLVKFLLGMVFPDDPKYVYTVVIGTWVLETLACIGVGVWGLMTLMSETVVKGFEYKPE